MAFYQPSSETRLQVDFSLRDKPYTEEEKLAMRKVAMQLCDDIQRELRDEELERELRNN